MTCTISHIGLVDFENKVHQVTMYPGLNVITGRSSTGKSAMLEIFDYCLGSSEDTIPEGVVTEYGKIFFVAFQFAGFVLVIGRKAASNQCFLRELTKVQSESALALINQSEAFFEERYFQHKDIYLKNLGRHFGVVFKDVDTDHELKQDLGQRSPTPSVRSFASFILQHQNLVANKHAIFYRFDEKRKRDQAIDHFKMLMGIANEDYFSIAKDLSEVRQQIRRLEKIIPNEDANREADHRDVGLILSEFLALAGSPLTELTPHRILENPSDARSIIMTRNVRIDGQSEEFTKRKNALVERQSAVMVNLRRAQGELGLAKASIRSADGFGVAVTSAAIPTTADQNEAVCPFCDTRSDMPEQQANKLTDAINWLNGELKISRYARESFAEDCRVLQKEIKGFRREIDEIQRLIIPLDQEIVRLGSSKDSSESALFAKFKMLNLLDRIIDKPQKDLKGELDKLVDRKAMLEAQLSAFGVGSKLNALQYAINVKMSEIGQNFAFEQSYKPVRLKFDLETFDLWFEKDSGKKIFLRSMGSGANWLYSHLSLFMALLFQFAKNSKECKIPPILFLDQPTQVYFPSELDNSTEQFNPAQLSERANRGEKLERDYDAVTNMFYQFAKFCIDTEKTTGVTPQIIVCDHADELPLKEGLVFENFVRARWRQRGFIDLGEEANPL